LLRTKQELAHKAIEAAEKYGLDAALVCSIIELSSSWNAAKEEWNPTRWLLMTDPIDVGGIDRWQIMATRWGLMQISGQEALFHGYEEIEELADPMTSLEAGCHVLRAIGSSTEKWFGAERKGLAKGVLLILPQYKSFVESRPCVNS
jgi:soluble lytic murein transglycosylase-like protein